MPIMTPFLDALYISYITDSMPPALTNREFLPAVAQLLPESFRNITAFIRVIDITIAGGDEHFA